MAGKPPILSSRSFKGQKALVGKQFRTGALGRALNDIYGDIDSAFANVEAEINGLDWKASVKVASTGNLTLSAPQTIDGVAVVAGDRVLAKDQTTASQNGIYVVAAAAWSRAEDANADAEVTSQLVVSVDQGTANADTTWRQTAEAPAVGTDAITFAAFGNANAIAAVEGEATLDLTGNVTLATGKSLTINGGLAGPRLLVTNTTADQVVARFTGGDGSTEITGGTNIDMGRAGVNRIRCAHASGTFAITTGGDTSTALTIGADQKVSLGGSNGKGAAIVKDVAAHDLAGGDAITQNTRAGSLTITLDTNLSSGASLDVITISSSEVLATDVVVTSCSIGTAMVTDLAAGSFKITVTNRTAAQVNNDATFKVNWVAL